MNRISIVTYKKQKAEFALIFVAFFFASITGIKLFGVSLNKAALLPLELYLILHINHVVKYQRQQVLLWIWYGLSVISCIIGLTSGLGNRFQNFNSRLILYAAQTAFIYFPISLLSGSLQRPRDDLRRAICLTAKINAVWAIAQFVSWYVLGIDFNNLIFDKFLHGVIATDWSMWNLEAGSAALRISGLNKDSAFFVLIMVMGLCLEQSLAWQAVFAGVVVLSLSRTGIATVILVSGFMTISALKSRVPRKQFITVFCLLVFGAAFIVLVLTRFDNIRYQINYAVFRFLAVFDSSATDVGTARHMSYLSSAIKAWADSPFLYKVFGVGPRNGGTALVVYGPQGVISFSSNMLQNAWSVESDISELLLGHGLLGFSIYVLLQSLWRRSDRRFRYVIFALIIMGFMYNYLDNTMTQLVLILLCAQTEKRKEC